MEMDITKKEWATLIIGLFCGIAAFAFAAYLLIGFIDWITTDPLNIITHWQ